MNKNIANIANDILKLSTDVTNVDPKIENRIKQVKKIYQQIKEIQDTIKEQVGDLQKQIKTLEKQADVFLKEVMPTLKEIEDHALEAEGIFIELKAGRRSPKVGYDYLANKVNSNLLKLAEEAISEAAKFAQKPSIKMTTISDDRFNITAGVLDWLKRQWENLKSWAKKLRQRSKSVGQSISELKKAVE